MTYIITIITGLVIYIFLNQLYKQTNHYKNIALKQNDYLAGVPSHIRIANFGSTYSWQAFSAHKNYRISSFNFALPCESLEFDNCLLRYYFSKLAHHCIIVLHIAPCATMYRINMLNESHKKWGILPSSNAIKVTFIERIKHHFPLFPFNLKKTLHILTDIPSAKDCSFITNENAYQSAQNLAKTWINLFKLTSLKTNNIGETNKKNVIYNSKQVEVFLTFCLENDFLPVIAIPPFSKELNKHFSDEFEEQTLGSIFKIAQSKNIPILNYRKDKRFQEQTSLYTDGCFTLNMYGSSIYLKKLFHDIQKVYHIPVNNQSLQA